MQEAGAASEDARDAVPLRYQADGEITGEGYQHAESDDCAGFVQGDPVRHGGLRNQAQDDTIAVESIPIADGGEGTVDAILQATSGEKISVMVQGPRGALVEAAYGWLPDRRAVVETAMAAGLPLMGDAPDVMNAGTYGVGEMIGDAIGQGAKRIYLDLGGSATNDGGHRRAAGGHAPERHQNRAGRSRLSAPRGRCGFGFDRRGALG